MNFLGLTLKSLDEFRVQKRMLNQAQDFLNFYFAFFETSDEFLSEFIMWEFGSYYD